MIGDYEIERSLGSGSMGAVFVAKLRGTGVRHALKVRSNLAGPRQSARSERFRREARALAVLDHPGIVRVHKFGEAEGLCYFSMDLLDGLSLADELKRGLPTLDSALRIGQGVAAALAYLHAQGHIHRDLKPANIMLRAEGGEPVLVDFGVVRSLEASRMTQSGQVVGTPSYMAPEQIAGSTSTSAPADVFALGVIMYRLVGGKLPFEGDTMAWLAAAILNSDPEPLDLLRAGAPPDLVWVVERCLRKSPADRPDAGWVADALATIRAGGALRSPARTWPVLGALALSLVLVCAGLLARQRRLKSPAVATERVSPLPNDRMPAPPPGASTRAEVLAALHAGHYEEAARLLDAAQPLPPDANPSARRRLRGLVALLEGELERARALLLLPTDGPILDLERERVGLHERLLALDRAEKGLLNETLTTALERLIVAAWALKKWPEPERLLLERRLAGTIKLFLLQMQPGGAVRSDWERLVAQGEAFDPGGADWPVYQAVGRWLATGFELPSRRARRALLANLPQDDSDASPPAQALALGVHVSLAERLSEAHLAGLSGLDPVVESYPFLTARVLARAHRRVQGDMEAQVYALLRADDRMPEVAATWRKATDHARTALRFGIQDKGTRRADGQRFELISLLLLGGRREEALYELNQFARRSSWRSRLLHAEVALLAGDLEEAEVQLNWLERGADEMRYGDRLTLAAVVLSSRGMPRDDVEAKLHAAEGLPCVLSWRTVPETRRQLAGESSRQRLIDFLGEERSESE